MAPAAFFDTPSFLAMLLAAFLKPGCFAIRPPIDELGYVVADRGETFDLARESENVISLGQGEVIGFTLLGRVGFGLGSEVPVDVGSLVLDDSDGLLTEEPIQTLTDLAEFSEKGVCV
jgi:hypothetical protein